jgi:hypothetical protein
MMDDPLIYRFLRMLKVKNFLQEMALAHKFARREENACRLCYIQYMECIIQLFNYSERLHGVKILKIRAIENLTLGHLFITRR